MEAASFNLSHACVCIAIALSGNATANNFSQTIFFGDSLTDSGYFKNTPLVQTFKPSSTAKFTTNPDKVWSEHFAEAYGSNATSIALDKNGNNYAGGGAKVNTPVNNAGLIPLSLEEQINKHENERGIDPNALYSVWIGANDLFAANTLAQTDNEAANKALFDAANNAGSYIKSLNEKGANNILVFSLPDVGLTPLALTNNKSTPAKYTEQSQYYNDTLMSNLKSINGNIIVLDTFSLLQEVIANPSAYGYTNVKDKACDPVKTFAGQSVFCTPDTYAEENANNTYVFADNVHPTGITHKSIAKYAQSVIEAPKQIGQTGLNLHQAAYTNNNVIQNHLNLINTKSNTQIDGLNLWGNVNLNTPKGESTADNSNTLVTVGIEKNEIFSQNSTSGLYVQNAQNDTSLTNTSTDTKNESDSNTIGLGFYHKQLFNNDINLAINLGLNMLDTSSTRKIELSNVVRTHNADGNGSQYIASARLDKTFSFDEATLAPFAQLTASKTKVDTLVEDGDKSTAMNYGKQDYDDTNAQIGVTGKYSITDSVTAFGQTAYSTRLSDDDNQSINARVNNLEVNYFSTPINNQNADNDALNTTIGLQVNLAGINAAAGINHSSLDSLGTGVFLELNKQF